MFLQFQSQSNSCSYVLIYDQGQIFGTESRGKLSGGYSIELIWTSTSYIWFLLITIRNVIPFNLIIVYLYNYLIHNIYIYSNFYNFIIYKTEIDMFCFCTQKQAILPFHSDMLGGF